MVNPAFYALCWVTTTPAANDGGGGISSYLETAANCFTAFVYESVIAAKKLNLVGARNEINDSDTRGGAVFVHVGGFKISALTSHGRPIAVT